MRMILVLAAMIGVAGFGVVFLIHPERAVSADSTQYIQLARTLREHAIFSSDPMSNAPELHRTPGYPLFLALFAPWRDLAHLRLLLAAQAALLLGSAWMLGDTARTWFGTRSPVCTLVSTLLLCNPVVLLLTFQVLTEMLFVFLCVSSLWLLARGWVAGRRPLLLLAGLLLGAAVLVRPIGLVLVLAGLGTFLTSSRPHLFARPRREAYFHRRLLPWLAGALLLPGAWAMHNGVAHRYWGISKTGTSFVYAAYGEDHLARGIQLRRLNPYDSGSLSATAALGSVLKGVVRRPDVFAREFSMGMARTLLGPGEWSLRTALLGEQGSRPGSGPVPHVQMVATESGLSFRATPEPDQAGRRARSTGTWLLILWSLGITSLTYLAAGIGAIRGLRQRDLVAVYCTLASALLVIGSSGFQSNARFRVPIVPYLMLLVALALTGSPEAPDRSVTAGMARVPHGPPSPDLGAPQNRTHEP
jgi:4-amino-4-deoxy-L-arabinose transferase-like glycosyltransferase